MTDTSAIKYIEDLGADVRDRLHALSPRIESLLQDDHDFFERQLHRQYRVRLADPAEVEQRLLVSGEDDPVLLVGRNYYVAYKKLAPDERLGMMVIADARWGFELSEYDARNFFDAHRTAEINELEAEMFEEIRSRKSDDDGWSLN